MMSKSELNIDELKAAALKATACDLDTAQIIRDEDLVSECPFCSGDGSVQVEKDYCNIDGFAVGVNFYGIGNEHGANEAYFRLASPKNIISLVDRIKTADHAIYERDEIIDQLRQKYQREHIETNRWKNRAELAEARIELAENYVSDKSADEVIEILSRRPIPAQQSPAGHGDGLSFVPWSKEKDFFDSMHQSPAVAVPDEETNFCALKSITDSQVNAVARAFWRRIYAYRNDYGIELPKPLPVEFMAHMATALTWVDKAMPIPKQEPVGCFVIWNSPELVPQVEIKSQKQYWVAIENDKGKKYAYLAQYINKPLPEDEDEINDHDHCDQDGEPIDAVGWFSELEHPDYSGYYEPIQFSDQYKMLGWAEYSPPAFGVNGAPSQAAAIPEGWRVTGYGQIKAGDVISMVMAGRRICTTAKQVLDAGTEKEEIVYNRKKNHYFITSMVLDGTSNHKDVFIIPADSLTASPSPQNRIAFGAPSEDFIPPELLLKPDLTDEDVEARLKSQADGGSN